MQSPCEMTETCPMSLLIRVNQKEKIWIGSKSFNLLFAWSTRVSILLFICVRHFPPISHNKDVFNSTFGPSKMFHVFVDYRHHVKTLENYFFNVIAWVEYGCRDGRPKFLHTEHMLKQSHFSITRHNPVKIYFWFPEQTRRVFNLSFNTTLNRKRA